MTQNKTYSMEEMLLSIYSEKTQQIASKIIEDNFTRLSSYEIDMILSCIEQKLDFRMKII